MIPELSIRFRLNPERYATHVTKSDFELVVDCIQKSPGLTGREISAQLRRSGHSQFTSKVANQTLYKLLAAELVERDGTGDKPRWFPGGKWTIQDSTVTSISSPKRPLDPSERKTKVFQIASTEVRVILDQESSSNDPYLSPDWVGSHVVASVNVLHPFWTIRLNSPEDKALYCMFAAVDAYVQWKIAQLHEPPDATELQNMRDYALRFCTLSETEAINPD